jgi:hypothetical protein
MLACTNYELRIRNNEARLSMAGGRNIIHAYHLRVQLEVPQCKHRRAAGAL